MNTPKSIIGVDMGGTNIRAGRIENGRLGLVSKIPTPAHLPKNEVVEAMANLISSLSPTPSESIGIGVPSIVDVEKGIVYHATNIKDWDEVHLKTMLEERLGLPVFVNNDANCFAAGEKHFGKAKECSSVVGLVLGTGLGAGLILNGHLYEGRNCGAGELANLPYLSHNYEYYCSGQYFRDELKIPAIEVFSQASQGEPTALGHFDTFGFNLGKFLQAVLYAYDPQMVVLGGSVSQAYPFFKESMMHSLVEGWLFPNSLNNLSIEVSELDNVAIYGAASLALEKGN